MSCEVERREGTIWVSGEMTIYAATALKEDLFAELARQPRQSRIDLSEVTELDTTGLQILLMARRECASRNTSLFVVNLSDAVRELLDLLLLKDLFAPGVSLGAIT